MRKFVKIICFSIFLFYPPMVDSVNYWMHQCRPITISLLTELNCVTSCFVWEHIEDCDPEAVYDESTDYYKCPAGSRITRQGVPVLDESEMHDACIPTNDYSHTCMDASVTRYPYTEVKSSTEHCELWVTWDNRFICRFPPFAFFCNIPTGEGCGSWFCNSNAYD